MGYKIIFFSHRFFPDIGGIESHSEILADEFTRQGHEVHLATWSKQTVEKKFPYKVINRPEICNLFKEIRWADIVFENNPCLRMSWPNFFVKKPLVIALHTWVTKHDGTIGIVQKIKLRWLQRAKKVIACSNAIRIQTFQAATIIGNPFDNNLFKRLPHINKTKDYIFLGRLVSDKGADIAISAFSQIVHNNLISGASKSTLTIVGNGEERLALERQAKELRIADKVIFTGSMKGEELVCMLNEHLYLLVPSLWKEPFGIVALEGLACGCLPIVSDGGGLPDAVGDAGIIFERGNIDSLINSMVTIKRDANLEMSLRRAAQKHLVKHEIKTVANQYLKLILEAVHN